MSRRPSSELPCAATSWFQPLLLQLCHFQLPCIMLEWQQEDLEDLGTSQQCLA